jgi:hypothetical protein
MFSPAPSQSDIEEDSCPTGMNWNDFQASHKESSFPVSVECYRPVVYLRGFHPHRAYCRGRRVWKISFAQVIALYFLYLADFDLQTLWTRAVAQKREAISKCVWEVTILRAVLAGGCFLLLVVSSFVFPPFREVRSLIIIFGFALFASAVLFEWVFQGVERMEYVALGRVLKGV